MRKLALEFHKLALDLGVIHTHGVVLQAGRGVKCPIA